MAYGRLDVYWPDGPVESYQLEKPILAVGRSTGNDIVLDTTAVSRYHITLTNRDSQIFLEDLDSANGTYVDSKRLKAHDPVALHGGEEIQIGDIRLIFQPQQTSDTKPVSNADQATRRIEITQPTYRVELEGPDMPVTPGAHVHAALTIQNLGADLDRFYVEVEGVPKEWVRVDRVELELNPGQKAPVTISFKPIRRSDSKPGDYNVIVRVRAKSRPAQFVEAPMLLRVLAYSGFGVALATPRIQVGEPFDLHLHNQGSAPLTLNLSGASPESGLLFDIRPPVLTLAPGERRQIGGYVRPRRSFFVGRERERRFDLLIRSQDASGFLTPVQGTLIEKSSPIMWAAAIGVPLIALLALGAIVLGITALNRPRIPVINTFAVQPNSVFQGDSVTLSWDVQDFTALHLKVDGQTPVPLETGRTSLTQVMNDAGAHTFTLVATNGSERAQKEATVNVSKALNVDAFTVTPNPVLRYVQQDVTIEWKVEGAKNVRFQGIEGLTGTPDARLREAAGTATVSGTPRDTLELTLIAMSDAGKEISQSLRVEIANPTCAVKVNDTAVYGGPGTVYPVLRKLEANATVSPDGRDGSSQWLHLIPAPDVQVWIPVSAVTCKGFAPGALTLISVIPPTPVITSTPTTPPTAVPTAAPSATPVVVPTHTATRPTLPPSPTATQNVPIIIRLPASGMQR